MAKLQIAIDVTPILPGGACGGAKPFVLELLRGLATRHELTLQLLTAGHNHHDFAEYERFGMTRRRVDGLAAPIGLRESDVDLLFCPMTAPTFAEVGVPTVCTVYDVQHLAYPWFFTESELAHRVRFYRHLTARADHVVCISEFSRRSLIQHFDIPAERTSVVPIAIHHRLHQQSSEAAWHTLAHRGLVPCRFAFYPANFWPHKNHRMLLMAFGHFLRNYPATDLHLVLTGELLSEGPFMREAIDRMGLADRVHVLGFVSEDEMSALWSVTDFLVFPSLFEGFGIPVLEAMHFGKAVLCSREGSLPEVGGTDVTYFDPRDPQSLVEALAHAVLEPEALRHRAETAQQRLAALDPMATVHRYLAEFQQVVVRAQGGTAMADHEQRRIEAERLAAPLRAQIEALQSAFESSEADRAARLEVIQRQGRDLDEAGRLAAALRAQVDALQSALESSEADRAARLEVIERQGYELAALQARIEASERLTARGILRQIADRLQRRRQ